MLEIWLEVKDGQKWVRVASGVLDIKPVKSTLVSIELADKEQTMCELTLQIRPFSRYFKYLFHQPVFTVFFKDFG